MKVMKKLRTFRFVAGDIIAHIPDKHPVASRPALIEIIRIHKDNVFVRYTSTNNTGYHSRQALNTHPDFFLVESTDENAKAIIFASINKLLAQKLSEEQIAAWWHEPVESDWFGPPAMTTAQELWYDGDAAGVIALARQL